MKSRIYILVILLSYSLSNAQTYTWQWAKTGGAINSSNDIGFSLLHDEHILDMVVDNQNNTYYLTWIYNDTPLLDGQTITTYGFKNILLFSVNCQGVLRWKRVIGGGGNNTNNAQKIVLDNNGGIYLTFAAGNSSSNGSMYLPPRFGDNDVMPVVNDPFVAQYGMRYGHLLKYNTADGNLVWRRDFQGDVSAYNMGMDMSEPVFDSQNNIHLILGFMYGTHLNGMITVPNSFNTTFQYYLVKYDTSGNIVGTPTLLPLTGATTFRTGTLSFMYDETNSRYYLAGSKDSSGSSGGLSISWNNVPITENAFVMAFNSTTFQKLWIRGSGGSVGGFEAGGNIFGLKKDPVTSDIYISGLFGKGMEQVTFGSDFNFTTPLFGSIPFVMKLSTSNSGSNVLWCTNPLSLSNGDLGVTNIIARNPIALKGNEVLFAKGSIREVWGTFPMVRPTNDGADPLLVKLNKDTGVVTGSHEVLGNFGYDDHFTGIAVDNDGNIMLGGFINSQLFVDPNDGVPTISNAANSDRTNFFYAKLATSSNCTLMATTETPVKETDVVFYPNPVEDILHIKTKEKLQSYEVITANGSLVKSGTFDGKDYTVNMQGLTKGVYYVKVQGKNFATADKVVKK